MSNPVIETDIADILKEIKSDQKKILEEVNALKLGQSEVKGDIKALDTKVEQLDKRISKVTFCVRSFPHKS
jgi:peptidoglycan hydrolase CwlO-like protein